MKPRKALEEIQEILLSLQVNDDDLTAAGKQQLLDIVHAGLAPKSDRWPRCVECNAAMVISDKKSYCPYCAGYTDKLGEQSEE